MKTCKILITCAFLFCVKINAAAQSPSDISEKIRRVEQNLLPNIQTGNEGPMTIQDRMAFYKVHGVSIAVIHNYKLEWAKGYGYADDSLKLAVTPQTLFQAASISKSINSVGVLKLVQDKKIDLYTDINTYLTTWKFPYDSLSKNKKITVANLLSHTGGLTVHGFGGYEKGEPLPTIPEILDGKKPANSDAVRSMYAPGIKSEYSGGGITISQQIVMDVTHQPYDKFMYDNVLKPLGMTSSTYAQPPVNNKPWLLATAYRDNGKALKGKYHIYPEQAAAGLWTNPTDLSKYIIETQLALKGTSKKVLDQQTTRLRLTPYIDKNAALGVFIDSLQDGVKYFEHGGANEGFRCQYYGRMEGGNGVVVMVNSDNGNIMSEIVNSVANVYDFKGLNRSKVRKEVAVADTTLQKYTGKYELAPGFILTVTREGNSLFGQATGQGKIQLYAESNNKFFLKVVDAEVEFVKDDKGQITKAVLYQNGIHDAKKIE
ncbi:serine hydrolase [Mucilaginibacter xinganensis]|uniref:CubicO group peptidase, beta-lactamase class C family n=1 Tax=Mucilaginibacter xinganensis TaxID=1234841 RepID=A0A223NWJ5_9SPHI|nr:serine hydrolase [Mucilaginibacter xinganensis]ASU34235.1 CubicO group peptidase, beta-lactamase class C family [Mucilaginibacter xinganensis]